MYIKKIKTFRVNYKNIYDLLDKYIDISLKYRYSEIKLRD